MFARKLFVLIFVVFLAACSRGEKIKARMLSRVVPEQARGAATEFLADYPECLNWSWERYTEAAALCNFVTERIAYEWEEGEQWKYPIETWNDRSGDCEDFAFFYCALLRFLGYDGELLLISGTLRGSSHLWMEYYPHGDAARGYLLDVHNYCIIDPPTGQYREIFDYHVEIIAVVP